MNRTRRKLLKGAAAALLACCAGAAQAQPPASVWRGNFVAGAGGLRMSPCRSGDRLAVEDRTPERDLGALYRELAPRSGRAIYIEFSGRRAGGRLVAERLIRIAAEGPGCGEDLAAVRLRAQSADPVWQLDARAEGTLFRSRGGREPQRFPARRFEKSGPGYVYEGAAEKSVLRVVVREGRCRDEMFGALFTLRAVAELDGRKYSGCAYWGDLGSE